MESKLGLDTVAFWFRVQYNPVRNDTAKNDTIVDYVEPSSSTVISPVTVSLIVLGCAVGLIIVAMAILYCYKNSKYRAQQEAKRRQIDMIRRLDSNEALPVLKAPNGDGRFSPPVICSTCDVEIKHVDNLCIHYARLLQYVYNTDYYMDRVKSSAKRIKCRSYNSDVTMDIDELLRGDPEFRKQFREWRSMDFSWLSKAKTALQCDSTTLGTSHTVTIDPSFVHVDNDDRSTLTVSLSPRKFSPQVVIKNAASSVRNFLTAEFGQSGKVSVSSWRTPSPGKTSTPNQTELPEISVGEVIDDRQMDGANGIGRSLSPSPLMQNLTAPLKYQSA